MRGFLAEPPRSIGCGFSVAFSFANGRLEAVWSPPLPDMRTKPPKFRKRVWIGYRNARDAFLGRLAAELGVNVGVVDL